MLWHTRRVSYDRIMTLFLFSLNFLTFYITRLCSSFTISVGQRYKGPTHFSNSLCQLYNSESGVIIATFVIYPSLYYTVIAILLPKWALFTFLLLKGFCYNNVQIAAIIYRVFPSPIQSAKIHP